MVKDSQCSATEGPDPQIGSRRRPRRIQVARACDGCRLRRTKCDNGVPCSKCVIRGYECSNVGVSKASTLTEASEEIARLHRRVQELEAALNVQQSYGGQNPPTPIGSSSPPAYRHNLIESDSEPTLLKNYYDGIQFRPARSSNDTWFGPSSLYSFIKHLGEFLNYKLQKTHPIQNLHPMAPSDKKLLDMPKTELDGCTNRLLVSPASEASTTGVYLTLVQEEYFINLFWQTYHTSLFPIVHEAQFKQHYQSLWVNGGQSRKPSALVDIIIAMCMQYATSTMPTETQGSLVEGKDALVAGRWHYWRGQKLLEYELDSPSLSTLQCHLLCAVYVCGGSFHNLVDISLGLAVRTAYMLGLHLEPPHTMPETDREMRRRLWWAVHLMDSKVGMKLGRPFMLSSSHAMPSLPSDTLQVAASSGSTFAPIGNNATWLSYGLCLVQLYKKAREAHTAFFEQPILSRGSHALWTDHKAQDSSVEVLAAHAQSLHEWAESVPEALKMARQNNGLPLSVDFTALIIEPFTPPWLQRQRLLLEHTYHHLSINIYRPLISFGLKPLEGSKSAHIAIKCASHSIMLTRITHQALTESSVLDGWHEAFHCQWNAVVTLVGFILLFPHSNMFKEAREAVELAILVFDNFGAKFSVAANASKITRDLSVKIDIFSKHSQADGNLDGATAHFDDLLMFPTPMDQGQGVYSNDLVDTSTFNLFDMATDIDFWNNVDILWPDLDNSC